MDKREIKLGKDIIVLDRGDLKFNDRTLNDFFERIAGRIDYIGEAHSKSQALLMEREREVEDLYLTKFKFWKEEGKSDKTAENFAKGDEEVQAAKKRVIAARLRRDTLYQHLHALNAAREDAHNRGHMLRRELEKLGTDIYAPAGMEDKVDQILKDASEYANQ